MKTVEQRLLALVHKTPSCWLFEGQKNTQGYGRMRMGGRGGRHLPAHRISYEIYVGPIPDGMVLDHLCRVVNCVNPAHLQAVTQRTNVLRGLAPAAVNAQLTNCRKAGHPLSGDNLGNDTPGHRRCKACRREYERERNLRRVAARRELTNQRGAA